MVSGEVSEVSDSLTVYLFAGNLLITRPETIGIWVKAQKKTYRGFEWEGKKGVISSFQPAHSNQVGPCKVDFCFI